MERCTYLPLVECASFLGLSLRFPPPKQGVPANCIVLIDKEDRVLFTAKDVGDAVHWIRARWEAESISQCSIAGHSALGQPLVRRL